MAASADHHEAHCRPCGGAIDTSRDHEYTDWAELRVMTLGFLAALREGAPTMP
ncbi:MAG: hypothetical protein IPK12_20255 [Gemmatimonadetes bacterium]|nr:hypothetical protein [Gemmatimonadota bacterium]